MSKRLDPIEKARQRIIHAAFDNLAGKADVLDAIDAYRKAILHDHLITVVKLTNTEKHPVDAICAIEGHCCFDRAYAIGRIDEKNGLPLKRK